MSNFRHRLYILLTIVLLSTSVLAGHPGESGMSHPTKVIPENLVVPQIGLQLVEDEMDGFNLSIESKNYRFIPPNLASKEKLEVLEGHAHIYINGVKHQRIYGQYVHLPGHLFKEGVNQLSVSLNDHDHQSWGLSDGKDVIATLIIDTSGPNLIKNHYSSSEIK